jgi:DNA-binding IclR family transcriptional regulator
LDGRARTREALLRELDEVRRTGLGLEREEMRHGICAVAVAVRGADGRTASIAVPMPTARFRESEEHVAERLLELRDATETRLRGA